MIRNEVEKFKILTLAERPDLADQIDGLFAASWPEFMRHDQVADEYFLYLEQLFPQFQFFLLEEGGKVIAAGNVIPFYWDGTPEGLPSGWDDVLIRGVEEHHRGRKPNAASALSIAIDPAFRGQGISQRMVATMKALVKEQKIEQMVAPVRPSLKHKYPLTPINRYVDWKTPDGAPFDPWVRTHWKTGAEIIKIATESMIIRGTVEEWESWTGMRFPDSGTYVVPNALVPVTIDLEANSGCYVEPNIWMRHIL